MSFNPLTSDNLQLSRVTMGSTEPSEPAINCTSLLSARVAGYVRDGFSENTQRAYRSDLGHFKGWGGSIPSTDHAVANYLAEHADTLSVATLVRRMASIAKAHTTSGFASPTTSDLVKATVRGIKRTQGTAQAEAKPLLKEDLFQVLNSTGETTKDLRDRALLLIGFAGGFRRSELVGLDHADVEHVRQGVVVHLRRSKTDQHGLGRKIGIPLGRSRWCPVAALEAWLEQSTSREGPIFRRMNRHGHVLDGRLSGEAVALIIRQRMADAGLDPTGFSGHSLRAGLATSAAQAGVSSWKIRQQTGHASDAMLARYIRAGELFSGNAAGALL